MRKSAFFACVIYFVICASAQASGICDLRDRSTFSPLDAEAFFKSPRGTLAIGEYCNSSDNICKIYIPISHCGEVEYSPPSSNGEISFAFSSVNSCDPSVTQCELVSTYLSSTMVMINNRDSASALPRLNTIRNASDAWIPLKNSRRYMNYLNSVPLEEARQKFFQLQSSKIQASRLRFEREVVDHWHTNFYAGIGRSDPRQTWEGREFFADRVNNEPECGTNAFGCSIKAYLTKFSETPTGLPSNGLRVNGKTGWADAVVFTSRAAMTDAYDEYVVVRINGADQGK